MAHIARLGTLTDELITILTSVSANTDANRFNTYRETALRSLRTSKYARTNQCDVQHQLEGLEEKFRIYNEDSLADALRGRLEELAGQSTKWTPDILHLFLELSNKPVANSKLEYISFLRPPRAVFEPALKWEDLVAGDPLLSDEHIWRNIDYNAESSDDEDSVNSHNEASDDTETSNLSTVDEDFRRPEDFAIVADAAGLAKLQAAQFWKSAIGMESDHAKANLVSPNSVSITELQVVREVLFMLLGLPTSLFQTGDHSDIIIRPCAGFRLTHVSRRAFYKQLSTFAEHGTGVISLRSWIGSKQSAPLMQNLQFQIQSRLRGFDDHLSAIQDRLVAPKTDVIVSLVELQAELLPQLHLLLQLATTIDKVRTQPYAHSFQCLEILYESSCISQMAGDDALYEFMGKMFFDCFEVYLRPIRRWMDDGQLHETDKVFFITEIVGGSGELGSIWQDHYKLRKTRSGALHAPNFLHATASKILTTGKSVIVLRHLGKLDSVSSSRSQEEPRLDFQTVCAPVALSLAPFSELFCDAFEEWVQSKHRASSQRLTQCLLDDCGLRVAMAAFETIYYMSDGAASSLLADGIFEKLDSGKSDWIDRFAFDELAQSTIGASRGVSPERLRVFTKVTGRDNAHRSRQTVKALANIKLAYHLPWPVQLIITGNTVLSYQAVFTFLLQIRRSSYMLKGGRLLQDAANIEIGADDRALYYGLRSRLLWFTTTIYSYLTEFVIRGNTARLHETLERVGDVDEMIEAHKTYIKQLAVEALLGKKLVPIHRAVIAILDLSIQLSDARSALLVTQSNADSSFARARASRSQRIRARNLDSSGEDEDSDVDLSFLPTARTELTYGDRLRDMRARFDHLCRFITTGLRGVARAGGEPRWDMLAETLEGGMGRG